ncbi:hypothetical protein [Mucilaginibacter xinganensis]|uniref:hypothetical protein n=1 Tax=Mucilaginibacter xinganensis TaxID=1234841 RepID=UPI000B985B61|nr:hypothetical protein [Mucilaginibacter xinganensis]
MDLKEIFELDFNPKREFTVVFQPIKKPGTERKRFLISINRLPDYIGENWTIYAVRKMLNMMGNKDRIKIRHIGFIDAYRK